MTLSVATTPSQSGSGTNVNEVVLHILQISKDVASSSDHFVSYTGDSLGIVLPLSRDSVGVYYWTSWLGLQKSKIHH